MLDEVLKSKPSIQDFIDQLSIFDIKVKPAFDTNMNLLGLSYKFREVAFKGSNLGKKYSWNNLKKLLSYHPKRDIKLLQMIKNSEKINDETSTTGAKIQGTSPAFDSSDKNDKSVSQIDGENDRSTRKVGNRSSQICKINQQRPDEITGQYANSDEESKFDSFHHDTHPGNNTNSVNHKVTKNQELKMSDENNRKRLQEKAWEISITGSKRSEAISTEEMDSFKKTLELAFEKRGNDYFNKKTGKLAFVEHADKITGHAGLLNEDGSQNMTAHRAMAQAAKLKFGDVFLSKGTDDYVKASWLAAAMIGCHDTGLDPEPNDCEKLLDLMRGHADKYGRPPRLHPETQKLLDKHRTNLTFTKKHMRTASGGKSDAEQASEEAQRLKNSSLHRTVSIGGLVDRFRKNNESEKSRHNFDREHLRK